MFLHQYDLVQIDQPSKFEEELHKFLSKGFVSGT